MVLLPLKVLEIRGLVAVQVLEVIDQLLGGIKVLDMDERIGRNEPLIVLAALVPAKDDGDPVAPVAELLPPGKYLPSGGAINPIVLPLKIVEGWVSSAIVIFRCK